MLSILHKIFYQDKIFTNIFFIWAINNLLFLMGHQS